MADGSIIIDTRIDSSGAESGLKSLGGIASKGLGAVTKATAVMATGLALATGAVAGLTKASIEQYSKYEQLTGGVETLFKTSSDKVMEYANNAYMTAGLSANEYMSTITGFSASLLQGLGGDTAKAAEIGNQAVTDMADNANKMGTSMESIQNAYQGFAKQNYTMLDNLKLGYGGTKTEMERLLADASKISGVKYDISNFSDVIEAIHTIQNEMGITGTTTKEAMSTIEGSFNMTKSAWSNMLTGMADDNADFDTLINNLVESVGALGENLLPRIQVALNGVSQLISQLAPVIAGKIPELVANILPQLVTAGINIVNSLITGIQQNLPTLANSAVQILSSLTTALLNVLPQLLTIGMQTIGYLAQGIGQQLPTLIPLAIQCIMQLIQNFYDNMPLIIEAGMQLLSGLAEGIINAIPVFISMLPQVIDSMLNYLTTSLPLILEQGSQILLALVNGIVQVLPQLIAMLPQIINSIVTFLTTNLPQIIDIGIQVLLALIDGLIQALPQLIAMLPQIITAINNGLLAHLPELINAGIQIIVALAQGLAKAIPQLIEAIPQIITALRNAFLNVNWGDIGKNILTGIGAGIKGAITGMVQVGIQACKTLKDSVKNFFGIRSPSHVMRDEVGKMLTAGIGVGITKGLTSLLSTAKDACNKINSTFTKELNADTAKEYINTISNIKGSFKGLADEIAKANDELEKASNADVMDDADYSSLYYKIEDLSGRIEDAQESKNETLQKTLEAEKKVLDKELALNKEILEKEIKARKEAAQEAVNIAKEKEDKLKDLASATVEAIKNKLTKEKNNAIDSINEQIDAYKDAYDRDVKNAENKSSKKIKAIEKEYNAEIEAIESLTDAKVKALQAEKDGLDKDETTNDRNKDRSDINNQIAVLEAKKLNAKSLADKQAYQLQIEQLQKDLAEKERKWSVEDKKEQLQEQIDDLKENSSEKIDILKAELEEEKQAEEDRLEKRKEELSKEYEREKQHLEKKLKKQEAYYDELLSEDSINAQARYILLNGSQDDLVDLLESYNPQWQDAGQSLADSLLYGLNSKKKDIKNAISDIMDLIDSNESYGKGFKEKNMATSGGYATGTPYNQQAGFYNTDELGFELATSGNVAYVSKGAGIMNHMQSLKAVKDEVGRQLSNAFSKYIPSNNSNVNNTTKYGDVNLSIDKFINNTNEDIEQISSELGTLAMKKKRY
ncbi:hypothetical protein ACQPUR_03380 [Clostridium neonatale]|uniref:phage tail protein n=1 Tax=Clostridium neonatale TaxID=137838 RepID=UPI003D33EBF9